MKLLAHVAWLAVVVAIPMVTGCDPNGGSRMYDVTAEEFELYYGVPCTHEWRYHYRGLEGDYHIIDYYGWGTSSWYKGYILSMRTHKDDLPAGFPTEPQPFVKDSLSPEDLQYHDRRLEMELSDASSVPYWARANLPLPWMTPPGGW